jgi:hypothetical protein
MGKLSSSDSSNESSRANNSIGASPTLFTVPSCAIFTLLPLLLSYGWITRFAASGEGRQQSF